MDEQVAMLFEFRIKPGERRALTDLVDEMVESTRAEPGALTFEWFIDGAGASGAVYERYADSAATLAHLGAFGEKFAERLLAAVDPIRFTLLGDPEDDVKRALDGFAPTHLRPAAGFAR